MNSWNDYKSLLNQIAQKKKLTVDYETTPQFGGIFSSSVNVSGRHFFGNGTTKAAAEQAAAYHAVHDDLTSKETGLNTDCPLQKKISTLETQMIENNRLLQQILTVLSKK
jgi:hypothetical protein